MANAALRPSVLEIEGGKLVAYNSFGKKVETRKINPRTQQIVDPEPDFAIVRPDPGRYRTRHPGPADIGLVIEVSDRSLDVDRQDKGRIYARAGLPVYWIVNLVDMQVEAYTDPSGPTATPAYATRTDSRAGDSVPVVLAGVTVAQLAVQSVL